MNNMRNFPGLQGTAILCGNLRLHKGEKEFATGHYKIVSGNNSTDLNQNQHHFSDPFNHILSTTPVMQNLLLEAQPSSLLGD